MAYDRGEARMPMDRVRECSDRLARRRFVQTAIGIGLSAASAGLLAGCSRLAVPGWSDRTPPGTIASRGAGLETTTIRFAKNDSACFAPKFVAEDLLRARGFT